VVGYGKVALTEVGREAGDFRRQGPHGVVAPHAGRREGRDGLPGKDTALTRDDISEVSAFMCHTRPTRPRAGQGACLLLALLLGAAAHAEVYPTGKPQQFFAGETFPVPANWRIPALYTGKTFHFTVYYSSFSKTLQTPTGPKPFGEALPWARDCIVRVLTWELDDPQAYAALLGDAAHPVLFFGTAAEMEPFHYPGASPERVEAFFNQVLKTRRDFGKRFLALDLGEWTWGGVTGTAKWLEEDLGLFGITRPTNHDEAAHWFDLTWDRDFKRYQDAGIPIYSFNCSTFNHYEARKGTAITGNEIAYINPAHDSTFIAFARGAARQYGIPWGMYAAEYGGPGGHSKWGGHYRPDERIASSGYTTGPYTGQPIQQERRTLFTCYMAGANFTIKESDSRGGMLADYDPATIERTSPRVAALQDKGRKYAGPYAWLCQELYDKVVTSQDRGTPYTPIALLFDRNHGLAFKYSADRAIGNLPYTTADEQMRAVLNTVFPYEGRPYAHGPFGEIFDVLTTDASAQVIDSYRAIVLVGGVRVSPEMAATLKAFVERGGALFMVCEQMTPELWQLAGISDTGELGSASGFLRASDFFVYDSDAYKYHRVKLAGATPLFLPRNYDDRGWPVATVNRVGKGAVIAAMPVWLNVTGDPTRTHPLFAEIIGDLARELTPVRVYGSPVKMMVNRNRTGWVVTLMNNEGVRIADPGYKPGVRAQSAAGVILRPKFAYTAASEWLTGRALPATGEVSVVVPAGDIRLVEFRLK